MTDQEAAISNLSSVIIHGILIRKFLHEKKGALKNFSFKMFQNNAVIKDVLRPE